MHFGTGAEGIKVKVVVFEGPLEPFDENVVLASAPAIHADADSTVIENLGERGTGKLGLLICVEDFRLAVQGAQVNFYTTIALLFSFATKFFSWSSFDHHPRRIKNNSINIKINYPLNCISSYPGIFSTHALYAFAPLDHLIVLLLIQLPYLLHDFQMRRISVYVG